MEEEYIPQKYHHIELDKQPKVLRLVDEYMKSIEETNELISDDQVDLFVTMIEEYNKQQESHSEEFKVESNQSLLVKIPTLEPKQRSMEELIARISFDLNETKYSVENNIDTQSDRMNDIQQNQLNNHKLLVRKFEAMKDQQRAKFLRYQTEDLKEEICALDSEIKEHFLYNLQYSQAGRQKEIQIKQYDIQKLNPPNYLNDTIINFYLKVIENLIIPDELRHRVYIFNTYFMDKLCPYDKVSQIPASDSQKLTELFLRSYETIKKWVKEDLFTYQYILFPLNLPEHWSLIIVSNPNRISEDSDQACIVYLDSFGIIDQRLISIVKMYLHKNQQEKNDSQIQYADSAISKIPAYQLLVPRQINYIDCGAFLLEYAESFLSNPTYLLEDIQNTLKQTKLRLFPRVLVNRKRYLIKKLILNLSRMTKEEAINEYKLERQSIIEQHVNNVEEYDEIEPTQFEEFLQLKAVPIGTPDRHQNLLDFYMNPLYNYYHNEVQLK